MSVLRGGEHEMLEQEVRSKSEGEFDDNFFDYLRYALDDLCCELAEKFNLYTYRGEPRRAFILDTLLSYSCLGCIIKVFTRERKGDKADALYAQNHRLAVNLLVEELRSIFKNEGLNYRVEEEAKGVYGRSDIAIQATATGVLIEVAKTLEILVEVKTGASFTYAQIFRYLIERPNAILILWRVTQHQIIVVEGEKIKRLLARVMETALSRGTAILNGEIEKCKHNPIRDGSYRIKDPQSLVDVFLESLVETIPNVAAAVKEIIRAHLKTADSPQNNGEKEDEEETHLGASKFLVRLETNPAKSYRDGSGGAEAKQQGG